MTQYDPNTLTGLLAEKASACPEAPALEHRDSVMTRKEPEKRSRRMAGGLRAMGVERRDRVALWLPNVPGYVALLCPGPVGGRCRQYPLSEYGGGGYCGPVKGQDAGILARIDLGEILFFLTSPHPLFYSHLAKQTR
jgi:hypothetical protein